MLKNSEPERHNEPNCSIYLPGEGLQGENIPSHILWDNMKVNSVKVSFALPLKIKEIFNAEIIENQENIIVISRIQVNGYIGISFESVKVHEIQVCVPVEYSLQLNDGETIKQTKNIVLFRPQLKVSLPTKEIFVDPVTGFVKGRAKIENIGRGTLMLRFSTSDKSPIKLETPHEYKEFTEKFTADLYEELSIVKKQFPDFQKVFEEIFLWADRDTLNLSEQEKTRFIEFFNKLTSVLASDQKLLLSFVDAYAIALARHSEFIEAIRKVISVYESLVSKDIMLVNPFEEAVITKAEGEKIILRIALTDRVFDEYKELALPSITLKSSKEFRFPIYRLFEWG
jgi:hypothetical protein